MWKTVSGRRATDDGHGVSKAAAVDASDVMSAWANNTRDARPEMLNSSREGGRISTSRIADGGVPPSKRSRII